MDTESRPSAPVLTLEEVVTQDCSKELVTEAPHSGLDVFVQDKLVAVAPTLGVVG